MPPASHGPALVASSGLLLGLGGCGEPGPSGTPAELEAEAHAKVQEDARALKVGKARQAVVVSRIEIAESPANLPWGWVSL